MGRVTRPALLAAACMALAGCGELALRQAVRDILARDLAPASPSELAATEVSSSSIHLAWTDNSTDETGFRIERSLIETSGFEPVTTADPNATAWDDASLAASTTYYYRVCAANDRGDSPYTAVAHALTGPAAPSGLVVSPVSVTRLKISWTDNSSDETAFALERSTSETDGYEVIAEVAAGSTSYDDVGLAPGTTYYYGLCASSAGGRSDSCASSGATEALSEIKLLRINADVFEMGDGAEGPNPPVAQTISTSYALGKYEVTNAQYAQFVADGGYDAPEYWTTNGWAFRTGPEGWDEPAYGNNPDFNQPNQPIVGVSWYEAVAFCNWRSAREGLEQAHDATGLADLNSTGYRLPTEVEWEYAGAKGGSWRAERIYAFGDAWDETKLVCSVPPASAAATAVVGSKSPDGDTPDIGLCDMSGNAREYCADSYQDTGIVSTTDRYYFVDDSAGQWMVGKGGAYYAEEEFHFRCAHRKMRSANARDYSFGFRLCRR